MTYNWRNYEPACWEPDDEDIDESEEDEHECFFINDEPQRYFDDIDAAQLNDIMVDNTMRWAFG